ncbi:hypothetical protein J2Z76_002751 [Sedimentibacter acidaminivorans]|jgi:PH (Pleckstrin Homology) domain-containing protein|uniref:Bacterial Pleckstrin homology domain-containing protein n=1 Tax=Sedimentibacter acidaminivorans TaxID=913099 RepID=A0ABS4GGS4_9FIRM|nr:PH domain-containing protein [Sedimentibacter acidaminivorans]MBP1926881.1 hypothetical protein [Sedimentibacter acidaminivorans]
MADVNLNKLFNFHEKIEMPETLKPFLSDKEQVFFTVKTIRDAAVFTDKRILVADKQGITGKKIEYYTIPYKNIVTYSVETAGTFDLDSEIKLQMSGGISIELKFLKDKKMDSLLLEVYRIITDFTFDK